MKALDRALRISKIFQTLISTFLLYVVYIAGIGITATAGKITGKKFLSLQSQSSTWQTYKSAVSETTMY